MSAVRDQFCEVGESAIESAAESGPQLCGCCGGPVGDFDEYCAECWNSGQGQDWDDAPCATSLIVPLDRTTRRNGRRMNGHRRRRS